MTAVEIKAPTEVRNFCVGLEHLWQPSMAGAVAGALAGIAALATGAITIEGEPND